MPYVSVAGIAGPGDAFCDPRRTLETLELVRRAHPHLNLCISTNGLNIGPYIADLCRLEVGYITVTVNAADPSTGARIYRHIRNGSGMVEGIDAARILLKRQVEAIAALKAKGITVKVKYRRHTRHKTTEYEEIAALVSALGADIMNIIGLIPIPGTYLEHVPPMSGSTLSILRRSAEKYLPQMRHCVRCRSDAAGLLGCGGAEKSGRGGPRFHTIDLSARAGFINNRLPA